MLPLSLGSTGSAHLRLLCLGAHSDDIEIGCGGTILRLLEERRISHVTWIVLGATGDREKEARQSAELFLFGAPEARVEVTGFRDGFFPYVGGEIKQYFEELKRRVEPDVIFTHSRGDLHQDHRLVCELTGNTFRDHFIFEYEVMKYDGDIGNPNFYVPLSRRTIERKSELLLTSFETQRDKHWFDSSVFEAIARLRGVESRSAEGYAEAFYCRKAVLA
jgi:LmbE family N-acetylglucosaminyl deacetylase